MDDVENLNRINALTKEFITHNIASSHDEAYEKAKAIIMRGQDQTITKQKPLQQDEQSELAKDVRALGFKLNDISSQMNEIQKKLNVELPELLSEISEPLSK